jgi:hypothetical protein
VKSLHLTKINARLERIWVQFENRGVPWGPAATADFTRLLETDIPELVQAVRDANAERDQARRELAQRAGTKYQVTVSSDAPIAVHREVILPGT